MDIIALGLGNWIDRYELQAIASDKYSVNLIYVEQFSALASYVDRLKRMLCNGEWLIMLRVWISLNFIVV